MLRRTLGDALSPTNSRICEALNLNRTDPRAVTFINLAIMRLLPKGHWVGTTPKYTVSVEDQLLTLPPQFATMESVAVCNVPVPIRSQWYEFADNGPYVFNDPTPTEPESCARQAMFRGNFPSFKSLTGDGNRIRVQCDLADDVGRTVLLLGYDQDGNWIRTKPSTTWQDGETVTLAQSPGTLSTNYFSRMTDTQKQLTNGQVWYYEYDGTDNTLFGQYQYWETRPSYRRYLLPTVPDTANQVDLIGKLCYAPVVNSTDYLIIGNLEALRLACMAIKAEEQQLFAQAAILMEGGLDKNRRPVMGAKQILEEELDHYTGSGQQSTMNIVNMYAQPGVEALL